MGLGGVFYFEKKEKSKLVNLLRAAKLKFDTNKIDPIDFVSASLSYEHPITDNLDCRDAHYFFYQNKIKENPKKLEKYKKRYHADVEFKYLVIYRKYQTNVSIIFDRLGGLSRIVEFDSYVKQSRPSQ